MDLRKSFKNKGKLFVISGPSGAGKGTICSNVMKRLGDDASLSVSATTREPREGEVDGVNYYFLSKEEFEERINSNGFLEYAEVYDHYYGTPRENVMNKLDQGTDVFLEIDIQGAMQVKDSFPGAVFIFILPPSKETLISRIEGRNTDSEDVIALRMSKAADEISYVGHYDYAIVNDDLDTAVEDIMAVIRSEKIKTDFAADVLDEYISSFEENISK